MGSLHEVARWLREINHANGFDAPQWSNVPVKLMMAVTELEEAREGIDTGDPNLEEELADTAIRLLDVLEAVFAEAWEPERWLRMLMRVRSYNWKSPEERLWRILTPLCRAVEAWRHEDRQVTLSHIDSALHQTFCLAIDFDIDLLEAIRAKGERNAQRGHLHGKTRSEG